jgi:hypothetical protein
MPPGTRWSQRTMSVAERVDARARTGGHLFRSALLAMVCAMGLSPAFAETPAQEWVHYGNTDSGEEWLRLGGRVASGSQTFGPAFFVTGATGCSCERPAVGSNGAVNTRLGIRATKTIWRDRGGHGRRAVSDRSEGPKGPNEGTERIVPCDPAPGPTGQRRERKAPPSLRTRPRSHRRVGRPIAGWL